MNLTEIINRLKVLSYKYNITPKHMSMSLFALADLMEQLPSTFATENLAKESGLNDSSEIPKMYRMIAREIMR